MTSTIKVDTIQDSGGNTIISSDGSGTITQTASIGSFSSTGIDDNASSTAITIDSSGNVGIGTSSPGASLDVQKSSGDVYVRAKANGTNAGGIFRADGSDAGSYPGYHLLQGGTHYWSIGQRGDTNLHLNRESGSGNVIVGAGNVGIGTSSPTNTLQVVGNIYATTTIRANAGNTASSPNFAVDGGTGMFKPSGNSIAFSTTNTEAMRIDTSRNVLVGKTSSDVDTSGFEVASNGTGSFCRSDNLALYLVRNTSDGPIVEFRKDGSTVGKITTKNGELVIGSGDVGVSFASGQDALIPKNPATNVNANNLLDIGISSAKWRDLYLGGSVYLGGTGSANALDDYEEGTFTLTGARVSWSEEGSTTGKYVKVGRHVHCSVAATVTNMVYDGSGSGWAFGGFPFTIDEAAIANFSECTCFTSAVDSLCSIGSELFARSSRYTSNGIASSSFNSGAKKLKFTVTYYTNS